MMETSKARGGECIIPSEGPAGAIAGAVGDTVVKEVAVKKRAMEVVAIEKAMVVKAAVEKATTDSLLLTGLL
jgi:hypothetical protein